MAGGNAETEMKQEIRIRDNLETKELYSVPPRPLPKPKVPGWVKAEAEQRRLDNDPRACWDRLVWSFWTTGKR
jgi:hypothetical protein